MPIAVALLACAMPASARYAEHWMTSSELARIQPPHAASRGNKAAAPKTPVRTAVTAPEDDPIAAFARDTHSKRKTSNR
jgi:hypothetical protein